MQRTAIIDNLSRRAPSVVVFTLCAALLLAWTGAPAWMPSTLAIIVGSLALLLFATRVRRHEPASADDDKGWLAHELAGRGMPPGSYVLAFFGFLTIVLTGFQGSYALPAWAAFALGIVWGLANRSYPLDGEAEG